MLDARTSVTKKGLPPVSAYTPAASRPSLSRHLGNRYLGKQREAQPANDVDGQLSEKTVELVVGTDLVVAVGDEQECRQTADPSPDEFQEIERRVVCPVDVFDHDRAWRGRQIELGEECREEALSAGGLLQRDGERAIRLPRDVVHGTEWPGRGERVAQAPECAAGAGRGEVLDKARLAYACLAGDRRDSAGALRGIQEEAVQLRQDRLALEEVHVAFRSSEFCCSLARSRHLDRNITPLGRHAPRPANVRTTISQVRDRAACERPRPSTTIPRPRRITALNRHDRCPQPKHGLHVHGVRRNAGHACRIERGPDW